MGFKLPVAPDSDKNTWQPRSTFLQRDRSDEYERYPMVTAQQLATRTERPKRVKMLVRDFIDGVSPSQEEEDLRSIS